MALRYADATDGSNNTAPPEQQQQQRQQYRRLLYCSIGHSTWSSITNPGLFWGVCGMRYGSQLSTFSSIPEVGLVYVVCSG